MAGSIGNVYMTLTYVDPKQVRCANAHCLNMGRLSNAIECHKHFSTPQSEGVWPIKAYLCDECFDLVRQGKSPIPEKPINPFDEANEAIREAYKHIDALVGDAEVNNL